MKRKRKAFVKVLEKLSWFLLISGLGLILACRSWSQIRVSGLGRDNLGYLTLVLSSIKCLNLNSIISGVLGPDDLGWLTLVLNSLKCLNLNSIMTDVFELSDLD